MKEKFKAYCSIEVFTEIVTDFFLGFFTEIKNDKVEVKGSVQLEASIEVFTEIKNDKVEVKKEFS